MSTRTVSYSATRREIELRELRRREERARQAMLIRLGRARSEFSALETQFVQVLATLDQARQKLPDLAYAPPSLPVTPVSEDPAILEQHVRHLERVLRAFERESTAAIEVAREMQERRRRLGVAWQRIDAAMQCIRLAQQSCDEQASRLGIVMAAGSCHSPNVGCDVEEAEAAAVRLEASATKLDQLRRELTHRVLALESARAVAGERVNATTAAAQISAWDLERTATARSRAQAAVEAALGRAELSIEKLPEWLQVQVALALDESPTRQSVRQVTDLIYRHHARQENIRHAECLLAQPPAYADDTTGMMHDRWVILVARLEAVICGHVEWSESLEHEYTQIQADCARAMGRAFARASFFESSAAVGFHLVQTEDDLAIMDIDGFPGYSLVVQERAIPEGYATVTELVADPSVDHKRDATVTEHVCASVQRLQDAMQDDTLQAGVEVAERRSTVTRAPVRRTMRMDIP